MVEIGQQSWLGIAASLGQTAFWALRNPWNLIGRLDDLAQDIQNIQLANAVLEVIDRAAQSLGAGMEISTRLKHSVCKYCHTANPFGVPSCLACGAPMGGAQPRSCQNCGFIVKETELVCPNCGKLMSRN
jgi:RNA polymerase subunit RPABC4/transcription elongation factor Spt4